MKPELWSWNKETWQLTTYNQIILVQLSDIISFGYKIYTTNIESDCSTNELEHGFLQISPSLYSLLVLVTIFIYFSLVLMSFTLILWTSILNCSVSSPSLGWYIFWGASSVQNVLRSSTVSLVVFVWILWYPWPLMSKFVEQSEILRLF